MKFDITIALFKQFPTGCQYTWSDLEQSDVAILREKTYLLVPVLINSQPTSEARTKQSVTTVALLQLYNTYTRLHSRKYSTFHDHSSVPEYMCSWRACTPPVPVIMQNKKNHSYI